MCQLLTDLIPLKNGAFIDVGVNVGQTLIKLRTVTTTMKYVGFEPNPRCVYYSNILIDVNRFEHCELIPVGLYDQDTVLALSLFSENSADASASVIPNFRANSKVYKKIYVPVFRFESMSEALDIGNLAIVKIDVEGAELEVLESLKSSISLCRPILLMEILPCYSEENDFRVSRQKRIEEIIDQIDYHIIRVKKRDGNTIETLEELKTIGIHGDEELCDYIISPSELTSKILSGHRSHLE